MSLSGIDAPGAAYAQDYTLRLTSNQNKALITLGRSLEHVIGVYVRDVNVRAPNGAALTPNLWVLSLRGDNLTTDNTSNAGGDGFYFNITNATNTNYEYTFPRLLSRCNRGRMNTLTVSITDTAGADVTFADATFTLVFVMAPTVYDGDRYLRDDNVTPNFPSLAYDTRARFARTLH